MKLRVVTPARQVVDAEVSELTAPGIAGEFGVLPSHATFLGGVDVGILSYKEGGATKKVLVAGGYGEVADDCVTVLADDAELAEEVDAAAARDEVAEVERSLGQVQEDPAAVDALLRRLKLAQARIELAS